MSMSMSMGGSGAPAALLPFLGLWVAMMAAMMLPSVAPVARLYLRVVSARSTGPARAVRVTALLAGYFLAWAAYGVLAFGLTRWLDAATMTSGRTRLVAASAALAVAGAYQFSPLKARCLAHCRSPLGVLMHVGSFTGRLRDARVGVWHGGYCLGCCWSLMLVLVAVGVMNMVWMAALALVILLEKVWRRGTQLSLAVGALLLVLAVLVPWQPGLIGA
jgi:predicted metal-binding membrane protein